MEIKTKFKIGDKVTDGCYTYLVEEIIIKIKLNGAIIIEYCIINKYNKFIANEKILKIC